MVIQINDYIEGYEYYGLNDHIKKVRGWVDKIKDDGEYFTYDIQADDNWNGYRGTTIFSELGKVEKLPSKERIKIN